MVARRTVEKELTREMIMNAAKDLFVEKGYQLVSMRQIAKELKYSHGAIYYHFKNKADLFYALVEDHFTLLEEKLDELVKEEIKHEDKLKKILLGYIEFGLTHQSHYEIMFLTKDEEVLNFINKSPNETYKKFADYIAKFSDRSMRIPEIWSIFLSLHGFVTHYLRHVVNYSEARGMAEMHVDLLLKLTRE